MIQHDASTREVLRRAGMSERSELTQDEKRNMSAALAALKDNPSIASRVIYRLIRPKPEEGQPET